MPERSRVVVAAAVLSIACAAGAWGMVSTQTGCTLQGSCDPSTVYLADGGVGGVTSEFGTTVWQSGPIDGTWLSFPRQGTLVIYPKLPDGGAIVGPFVPVSVQVSADPRPYPAPSNFAPSAGNITEFSGLEDGGTTGFQVTNNTCSPYYLYLQMGFPQDAGH